MTNDAEFERWALQLMRPRRRRPNRRRGRPGLPPRGGDPRARHRQQPPGQEVRAPQGLGVEVHRHVRARGDGNDTIIETLEITHEGFERVAPPEVDVVPHAHLALPHGLFDDEGARHRRARLRPPTGYEELELAARGPGERGAWRRPRAAGRLRRADRWLPRGVPGADRRVEPRRPRSSRPRRPCVGTGRRRPAGRAVPGRRLRSARRPGVEHDRSPGDPTSPQPLEVDRGDARRGVRAAGAERRRRTDRRRVGRRAAGAGWSSRGGEPVGAEGWRALDPASVQAIAIALAGLDPAADLAIVSSCPQCGAWIEVELDPVELLVQSLATGSSGCSPRCTASPSTTAGRRPRSSRCRGPAGSPTSSCCATRSRAGR